MDCSNCGATNDAGQKFCGECGTSLSRACPACGAPAPRGRRFCGECGASLEVAIGAPAAGPRPAAGPSARASIPAPVAERRLVSVLFADLVGFTPFAEERDAEDVREALDTMP